MKRLLFSFILLAAAAFLWSQEATSPIVNLGEILFQQPKTATFHLKNTGAEPMTITAVHPSCGCVQVEWSQDPVAPQESATLSVVYDAQLLGTFQKEVEVWTSASGEPVYLTLQGRVVATASDHQDAFPVDLGSVRLSSNSLEFDDVNNGDHPEAILRVLNTGRSTYKPVLMHLPSYLTARYQPEQLAGGRVGSIILTLDSEKLKSYGLTQTSVYLARYLGDKVCSENEIDISAVLLPGFAHLTAEELRTAPHMTLSSEQLDFTDMGTKKKMTKTLIVSNDGHRPLTISRLQVYGKALSVSLSDRIIKPGKQAKLKVTLNTAFLKASKATPRVLLITDDPKRPKTVLTLKN